MAIHEAVRIVREEEPTKLSTIDRHLRGDIETIAREYGLSNERMLKIANNSEYFTSMIDELSAQNEFSPEQITNLKLDLVQALINAIVNEGVEDLNAFAFKGVSITYVPPAILIPSINFSILGQNRTYYCAEHSTADVEAYSESQIIEALRNSEPQRNEESRSFFILPTQSVDIVIDADGNETMTRIVPTFAVDGDGNVISEDIAGSSQEMIQNSLIQSLNANTSTTGLTFERVDSNDDYAFGFRIGDYNTDLSQYGVTRETELLASRYSGITIEHLGNGLFGIKFGQNPTDLPGEQIIIARQDITSPYGLQPTRTILSFNSGTYTEASEIRNNPFLNETIHIDSHGNVEQRTNINSLGLDSPEFTINNIREHVDTSRLFRIVSDEEYLASQELYDTLTLEGGIEGFQFSEELTQELQDLCDRLLDDRDFLQRIREATSIDVDLDTNRIEDLPDFNELSVAIKEEYPALNDASISYIISRLTPGTLMRVNDVPRERRLSYVNNTTELTARVVEAMASELNIENPEQVAATIISLNLIDETSQEQILENIFSDQVVTSPFPGTESRDGENLEEGEMGVRDITANHIYTMVGSSGVVGLRETIFDFEAEQALPEGERSPQIINNSLRRLDLENPEHVAVAEFLYKLYEPQINQNELNSIFDSGFDSGNFDALPDNQTLQAVLQSNAALQLLSLNMNQRDGNILSLVSYYLNDEQNPGNTQFLYELYTYIRETNAGRQATMPTIDAQRAETLRTFVNWTMQILNSSPGENTISITNPETGEELFSINSNVEAGTFLIRECANLSFYFDREINANLRFDLEEEFLTNSADTDIITRGSSRTTRSEGELGFAAAFDVRDVSDIFRKGNQNDTSAEGAEGGESTPLASPDEVEIEDPDTGQVTTIDNTDEIYVEPGTSNPATIDPNDRRRGNQEGLSEDDE